jgi:hypothetical protein
MERNEDVVNANYHDSTLDVENVSPLAINRNDLQYLCLRFVS